MSTITENVRLLRLLRALSRDVPQLPVHTMLLTRIILHVDFTLDNWIFRQDVFENSLAALPAVQRPGSDNGVGAFLRIVLPRYPVDALLDAHPVQLHAWGIDLSGSITVAPLLVPMVAIVNEGESAKVDFFVPEIFRERCEAEECKIAATVQLVGKNFVPVVAA